MSRVAVQSQLKNPDSLARQAGIERYDSQAGNLRRRELHQLGNAWGLKFPIGATKDYMLTEFRKIEAEGKNLFRPPHAVPDKPEYNDETHVEPIIEEVMNGEPVLGDTDLRAQLEVLHIGKLKKLVKMRGLKQSSKDKREELIARLMGE